jgi:hypothetical protein
MEAAPFGNVPPNDASLGQDEDLFKTSTSSSRNLPIREVSETGGQRAQARDMAKMSTSLPRNLRIQVVSESAVQKAQDEDSPLNANAPVWEMARTFPLRGTSEAATQDYPVEARVQRYADEICNTPFIYNDDMYSPREHSDLLLS